MPIQGTAADMIKLAMIRIQGAIVAKRLQARMLLQVHDELVFEVPREEETAFKPQVVTGMQESLRLNVPVKVDVGVGQNWMDAH
jgi:DNA polymerase-1